MSELVDKIFQLQTPFNMVVIIVIVVMGAGIITGVAKQIRKYAGHRHELDFKRDMLDRGMSAEEIALVIETTAPKEPSTQN